MIEKVERVATSSPDALPRLVRSTALELGFVLEPSLVRLQIELGRQPVIEALECRGRRRHRTHVVPPCVTTAEEVREGLAILDDALGVADMYYTGA